jgi:hypothetical protein
MPVDQVEWRQTMFGYRFVENDTTHLGYDAMGKPLYVCDKCSGALAETAVRYRYSTLPYARPEPGSYLWRYMDFAKYVSLLSSRSIFFARVDTFGDQFEGAKGLTERKKAWDAHFLKFFREALRTDPGAHSQRLSGEEIERRASKFITELEHIGTSDKTRTFVSCWHENQFESEAMWRLYSSFVPNAIAVRTTYERLYEALGRYPQIPIGRIKYIDMNRSFAGVNDAFWRKRISFQHENEVRALIRDHACKDLGKLVSCDLHILVEAVYVSPLAPHWFSAVVNDVTAKYGLSVTVSSSKLNDEHFF